MPISSTEINRWLTLIKLSEEERKEKQPAWEDLELYFRGIQWNKSKDENKDIISVNFVYSHIKIVVPSVYSRNPKLYFEPNKASSVDGAKLTEYILNGDMQKMKLKSTNKQVLQDTVLYGTGYTKTTYELEEDAELIEANKNSSFNDIEEFYNLSGSEITKPNLIPKSGPRIIRVEPDALTFAVGATDFEDPGFIAHKVRKRLYSVKNDPYYKNTRDLQPTAVASPEVRSKYSGYWNDEVDEYLSMVDLYEIWDVENQNFFVIADGHQKALREKEDNPYSYPHPFDRLIFTRLKDQMWGLSEIEPWIPQQDEFNKVRTQHQQHVKRYNRKYVAIEKAFVDEEDKQRLEAGEDGVVVFVRGDNAAAAISSLQDAPLPPDSYRYALDVKDDIIEVGGIPGYRRGNTIGANTATEAGITERGAQTRDSDRIDYLGEFVLSQMEKVRKSRKDYTPGQQIVAMTDNPMDGPNWEKWRKEDIDVDSDMRVEFGSTMPINQASRKSDAILLYDRAVVNPTVNPQSAFSNLLEAFDQRDQTKWFLPQQVILLQMLQKAIGAAQPQKGISAQGPSGSSSEPGPITTETPGELRGRAAPI